MVASVRAQRLSVRLLGQFMFHDYENRMAVILENCGAGPMIIDEFRATRAGKVVVTNSLVYAEGLPFDEMHVVC